MNGIILYYDWVLAFVRNKNERNYSLL
jgi:hypothetical protein